MKSMVCGLRQCEYGFNQFIRSIAPTIEVKIDYILAVLYPNLFSKKIGTLNTQVVKLYVDKTIRPVKHQLRPIQIYMQEAIKKELQNLKEQGIIEPVDGPTEWLSSIVPVVKVPQRHDQEANKAKMRERYQFPTHGLL